MAGEPIVTIVGNLASDPELRFLPSGIAVCSFTVAETPRVKKGEEWIDGETMWVRCTVWRQPAENATETLTKGMRVMVHGRLKVSSWEKDGEKRTGIEMDVEHFGPELRYATAKVNKVSRDGVRQNTPAAGSPDPWTSGAADPSEPPF